MTGAPRGMGYCHCSSCRGWSARPVNTVALWAPDAVRITKGAYQIASVRKSPNSLRKWCEACGGHRLAGHPQWKIVDVYAATIPSLPARPGVPAN